jgi:O-antigen ligase
LECISADDKREPYSGKGLYKWSGFYPQYFGDYFNDKNLFLVHNIHAHNDFLEIFSESGIAASLIFFYVYCNCINSIQEKKKNEKYFVAFNLFATLAFSFVAFPYHKLPHIFGKVVSGAALMSSSEKGRSN